ncbi:MAG: vanomycin resistance protein VanB [Pseudonocardiaceae bacterium]|nr:vanomycin resistance protein VanB [Pseudonocardiaceae bacterium]
MPDDERSSIRDDPGATGPLAGEVQPDDAPTADIPPPPHPTPPDVGEPGPAARRRRPRLRRGLLVAAAVVGLLGLLYGADLALSRGEVPRGVIVAGVDVGGMERGAAAQLLRQRIEPRLTQPVPVRAGDVETTLDPSASGLALDWPATLDRAGDQPLNPWTRLTSLFTSSEVGVVTSGDRDTLRTAFEGLRAETDRQPVEGTIRFEGVTPVPVDPVAGQTLDVPAATDAVLDGWASGKVVQLPVSRVPVSTTPEGVRTALTEVAEPAVSGPVTVTGDGADAVLEPEVIADSLRFAPGDEGALQATIDKRAVREAVAPQLAGTERRGNDAEIVLQGGSPTVLPSATGRGIDWQASLEPLMEVLTRTDDRSLPARYVEQPPELTTEEARSFGIRDVIGEFTTGGFASDSGVNIERVAEEVNGAVVAPGETFSLNGYTGHRGPAQGYVQAGIIEDGRPARGIGGGISQFATTLFNASYFAGMTDIEHHEHSYYISRYPEGREATVFEGALDVEFRNDSPTGILIQTAWTPDSITVKFWGTKQVDVESMTSERSDFTPPPTKRVPGEPCIETSGSQGFSVTNTRVMRDADTGAVVNRNSHTTVYDPLPKVVCTG